MNRDELRMALETALTGRRLLSHPFYRRWVRGELTVDDLRGLPPAYIDVGELDPFRDEDIQYAQKLLQAGVPCELHVTPGAFHGSDAMVLDAPSSMLIRSYRRDFLRRVLG